MSRVLGGGPSRQQVRSRRTASAVRAGADKSKQRRPSEGDSGVGKAVRRIEDPESDCETPPK